MLLPCLAFSTLGKKMRAKHSATRWPAPDCSMHCACIAVWPKGNGTEMDAALFTKNGEGRSLTIFDASMI